MRAGSGLAVGAASLVALVGAWRMGQTAGDPPATAAPVPPSSSATSAPAPSSSAATKSGHRKAAKATTPAPTGTFTGNAVATRYGNVQVKVVMANGRLVDVQPVQLTNHGGRSVSISARSAPILRGEALSAQSARIDTVSGASYTSAGYIQSLQSALDQARAAA